MYKSKTGVFSAVAQFLYIFYFLTECSGHIGFLTQPKAAIVGPDLPLLVDCTANTNLSGTLHILWKRNDSWITDYTSKHYRQFTNGSLYFERFLYGDQGTYQCSALVISSHNIHLGQIFSRVASIKVAYLQNSFTLHPDSRSALLGETIQLQCISPKSEPIAKIDWEKDGKRVTGLQNVTLALPAENVLTATLLIQNLNYSSTGRYRCIASNRFLSNVIYSKYADITITAAQERPYFEKRPSSSIVTRFRPFTWECRIRGVPQPTVHWYHNGRPVINDTNRFMLASGSLHFASMQKTYNGSYFCEGRNTLGSISLSPPVALVVAYYEFAVNPVSKNVTYGNELVLQCSPPTRYPSSVAFSWYKDFIRLDPSANISVSSDGTLRITGITKAYEGTYFCQVVHSSTNQARSSKRATVIVQVLPSIGSTLGNTSALVGDSLTRSCQASGYPLPVVTWLKDGRPLSVSGNLLLANISLTDAGYYTCFAINVAGSASKRFFLRVSTFPAVLIAPANTTKIVGESAQFRCEFYGNPKPTITWFFSATSSSSRVPVTFDSRVIKTHDGIRISSVRKTDEGRFICRGVSSGGALEISAFLRVYVPPSFVVAPRNMTTVVSSRVSFHYTVAGDPAPVVSWYHSGILLSTGSKYGISATSFTVKAVSLDDSGWYICQIRNQAGQFNVSAHLDVQVAPRISGFSVPTTVVVGGSFSLLCNGSGNPDPAVRWVKNRTIVLQVDGTKAFGSMGNMRIVNAQATDSGTYECILTNSLGTSTRNGTLIVQVQPYPPKQLRGVSTLASSITVSWLQGFDGYSSTLGYVLEISRKDAAAWRIYNESISARASNFTIVGLQPYTIYSLRMKSFTAIAISGYSATLDIRTLEGDPSVPRSLRVVVVNATAVTAHWQRPAQANGNLTAYEVEYQLSSSSVAMTLLIAASRNTSYHAVLSPLRPFSNYFLRVRAATGSPSNRKWGNFSSSLQFKTGEAAPSAAPLLHNVTAISSTAVSVAFRPLHNAQLNGILLNYDVRLAAAHEEERKFLTKNTQTVVTSLRKFASYTVRVRACTSVGCGPFSSPHPVTTLEDQPGHVGNASVVALSPTSFIVSWSQPAEQFGNITGYIISIRAGASAAPQNTSLSATQFSYQMTGAPNVTYLITVAAQTKVGVGPWSPFVQIKLEEHFPSTTKRTSSSTKTPTTWSRTPLSTTDRSTVGAGRAARKSVDWLDEKNLPILIGVSVTIFVLLIIVIVLFSMHCARRLTAGTEKRERWLSTRTQSGAENPGYMENGGLELRKSSKIVDETADHSNDPEEFVDSKIVEDDFIFEQESESQPEDGVNPSHEYAADDTMRIKDDNSPLIKLRNSQLDLSDDASEYDQPYTQLDELGTPIQELFSFFDDEKDEAVDFSSTDEKDNSRKPSTSDNDAPEIPLGRTAASPDYTWDNYDTSKAAAHNGDSVLYDTPVDAATVPDDAVPEYATVNKNKDKKKSDQLMLIGNEERT